MSLGHKARPRLRGPSPFRPHRLEVRTVGFHPTNWGSIPHGVTSIKKHAIACFFMDITSKGNLHKFR